MGELDQLQRFTQEQSEKNLTLQKQISEKEEEIGLARKKISDLQHDLTTQTDLLRTEISCKQQEIHELHDVTHEQMNEIALRDNELNNAKTLIHHLQIELSSVKQEIAIKGLVGRVQNKALAELTEELTMKQFESLSSLHCTELEKTQKENEELSNKLLTLHKEVMQKEEEIVETKEEMSHLNDQIAKQSKLLNTEMGDNQKIQNMLADKEKIKMDNETYKAELNSAKVLIQQLRMEQLSVKQKLTDNKLEMTSTIRMKDDVLTKLKEELISKQNCLDATVSRLSAESKRWQIQGQEQSDNIIALQQEVEERDKEIAAARKKISDLQHDLTQRADLLRCETACKQTVMHELHKVTQEQMNKVATLESKVREKEVELASVQQEFVIKHVIEMMLGEAMIEVKEELTIEYLNSMHSTELEKVQNQSQQLSDKISTLHKEVIVKEEELVETRKVMSQQLKLLNAEIADKQKIQTMLADKERNNRKIVTKLKKDNEMYKAELDNAKDLIQQLRMEQLSVKQKLTDNELEMTAKIKIKDDLLSTLKEELISKQNLLDAAVSRELAESDKWKKQGQEQSDSIATLQQEVEERDKEIAAARKKISELQHDLTQGADLLRCETACKQTVMHELHKVTQEQMNKVATLESEVREKEVELASVQQEFVIKHEIEKMLGEVMIEVKEELTIEYLNSMHSTELEKFHKQSQQLSDKVSTLHKEVMQKEEELVETKKEMSHLNDQLAKQSELLNAEMIDKQKIQNILEKNKQKIHWRVVDKLEMDNEMYKAELDDARELIQQLRIECSVKQKLADNQLEMTPIIRMKDDVVSKFKGELISKENYLDPAVSRELAESAKLQKQCQEQPNNNIALQQEVEERDKETAAARKKTSDLHYNLTQESDLPKCEKAGKQTMIHKLHNVTQEEMNKAATLENKVTETMQDKAGTELKEEVTMKQFESLNSVPSIEQNKRQKRQKKCQQLSDKVLTLHKEVLKTEKFVERRKKMCHLDDQLEEQTELTKPDFKEELSIEQNCMDSAVGRQLPKSEKSQQQGQEQPNNNISLQQGVEERDKETAVARKKISDLHYNLTQESDLPKCEKAGKQTVIHELHKVTQEEMNKVAGLEKVQDEAGTELKEEDTMKQCESLNSVHSTELKKISKQSQQPSDEVATLHKEVMEAEKIVEMRKEMSNLKDQLEKQTELLLKPDVKEELSSEQNILDAAMVEKWQKQSQEQSEALQIEVVEGGKEIAETRDKMELAMDEIDVANDKSDMIEDKAELEIPTNTQVNCKQVSH